jgi:hypothetical protein
LGCQLFVKYDDIEELKIYCQKVTDSFVLSQSFFVIFQSDRARGSASSLDIY